MITDEEIRKALQQLCAAAVINKIATVTEVNEENYTITVEPEGEAPLSDVRLKAGIDNKLDGLVEIPKVGSYVVIGLIGNDPDNAFVVKCSEVEKIIMFGGDYGGLVIIDDLKSQWDSNFRGVNSAVSTALAAIDLQLVALGQAGGTSPVFGVNYNSSVSNLLKSTLEDTKVTH